jgi:glycerophosphoryl diester phosphodiesterase
MMRAPENTVAAFKTAFADGAAAVECDIRRTADGQFVAFHDADAGRLCGRSWSIARTAWPHLKTLRVLGREPIAHLDDILNLMILRPGKDFFFELALRGENDAADLARQISRAGVQSRAVLLAFSHKRGMLAAARAAVPGIGTAVMPLLPRDIAASAEEAGVSRVCTGWVGLPLAREVFYLSASAFGLEEQAAAAARLGIEVSAGIANDPRDVRRLAELGVAAVWTDDVPMAAKYL